MPALELNLIEEAGAELFLESTIVSERTFQPGREHRAKQQLIAGIGARVFSGRREAHAAVAGLSQALVGTAIHFACGKLGEIPSTGQMAAVVGAELPEAPPLGEDAINLPDVFQEASFIGREVEVTARHHSVSSAVRILRTSKSDLVSAFENRHRWSLVLDIFVNTSGSRLSFERHIAGSGAAFRCSPERILLDAANTVHCVRSVGVDQLTTESADVFLEAPAAAMLFHEILGHCLEENGSLITHRFARELKTISLSEELTVTDSAAEPGLFASATLDDAGRPTKRITLIQNGMLKNILSQDIAPCARRPDFRWPPLSRMSNLSVMSGSENRENVISEIENGIYISRIQEGNLDRRTLTMSAVVSEARIIRSGKLRGYLTPFEINDSVPRLLANLKGICDDYKTVSMYCESYGAVIPVTVTSPSVKVHSVRLAPLKL